MPTVSPDETTEALPTGALHVDRAMTELRRGRFVKIFDNQQQSVVAAVDTHDPALLRSLLDSGHAAKLIISGQRATALGQSAVEQAWQLPVSPDQGNDALRRLAGLTWEQQLKSTQHSGQSVHAQDETLGGLMSACTDSSLIAGLELARMASLPPALIATKSTAWFDRASLLTVDGADIRNWATSRDGSLLRVSDARVPLQAHEHCRFILYRERFGGEEHVAIVVGQPATDMPVLVRLHSACLTGDLFASLRCDCGEQLHRSVEQLGSEGGGIILYLAQEGRGIGLANKLRAYQLQDQGLDTLEADRHLGFRDDERNYSVACAMLRELGVARVRLMTNNPVKVAALRAGGIEVVDRSPVNATVNPHNARYIQTKQDRAGHFSGSHDQQASDAAD